MMRSFNGQVQEHKALNTLLQCAGAVVMTAARVWLYDRIKETGLSKYATKVLDYHDEETYECHPYVAPIVSMFMEESVRQAGIKLGFNCPLDAGAEIGMTWAEIH